MRACGQGRYKENGETLYIVNCSDIAASTPKLSGVNRIAHLRRAIVAYRNHAYTGYGI